MGPRAVSIARALLGAGRGHVADDQVAKAAREHVGTGPLEEALLCLALAGDSRWLADDAVSRARVDLLIWEAGARALVLAELGAWMWNDPVARRRFVFDRAGGSLRARALAARALLLGSDGCPSHLEATVAELAVATAGRLASHPEPVVWIPAARALGRLSARLPAARLMLQRWHDGARSSQRRRGLAALASAPAEAGLADQDLANAAQGKDPWYAAALGVAAPLLARERPSVWGELAPTILERSGAQSVWSLAQGLSALCHHEEPDEQTRWVLRQARSRAIEAKARSTAEAQLWQSVRDVTDFLDELDPDPAFPASNLERAVRDAVRVGAARTLTRAKAAARSIAPTFEAMLRTASGTRDADERGHALSAAESCTRAAALGLWRPLLAAAGKDPSGIDDEQRAARVKIGSVLTGYLELDELGFTMRRAALRGLGHMVDAERPAGRSRQAAFALSALAASKWARSKPRGSARRRFRKPVTDLLWRLGDALGDPLAGGDTSGPSLGRVAAWWALSSTAVDLLDLVQPESQAVRARIDASIRTIRDAAASAAGGASVSRWGGDVTRAIAELGAGETRLAHALARLLAALDDGETALRRRAPAEVTYSLQRLATALSEMSGLGRDPARALEPYSAENLTASSGQDPRSENLATVEDPRSEDLSGQDPRSENLATVEDLRSTARASIRTGVPGAAEVADTWAARVGGLLRPAVAPLVKALVELRRAAVEAETRDKTIGPYRVLRQLGGGGHGEVWLVQRDGRRRFVLKRPRRARGMSPEARAALSKLIEREARTLEDLHEGKLASFIDHGFDGDTPYLVLEYLVGVDLFQYASVRLLDVDELAPLVRDVCIGLRALHGRGIVHRDLKPSNVFLRLVLPPEANEEFRPEHRDPRIAPISDATLIDFGVARLMRDDADVGEAPEGTLGYLSPEQAESSDDVTGKSDVYALAATLFHVLTGKRFFQDRPNATAQMVAHAFERPMRDRRIAEATAALPAALVELFDDATSLDPDSRPDVDTFAARYAAIAG